MNANIAALLYLVAASVHPGAARTVLARHVGRGNLLGMIGMTIAVLTTLARIRRPRHLLGAGLGGIAIGGGIGAVIARRVR